MGIHLPAAKISYFSVPKCACTSIKHFFFELENGRGYERYKANGANWNIHHVYRTRRFDLEVKLPKEDHWKCAVVREPVSRFLSAYANRVLFHDELDSIVIPDDMAARGVVVRPDLSTFVKFLKEYRALSRSINTHTAPMITFLGRDAGYFDRLYNLKELDALVQDVSARAQAGGYDTEKAKLRHRQTGGPKLSPSELSAAEIKKIESFYAADYETFAAHM